MTTAAERSADIQHGVNAWLARTDGGRYAGDAGLRLETADFTRWPVLGRKAFWLYRASLYPVETVAEIRQAKIVRAEAERDNRFDDGGTYDGNLFQIDGESQARITAVTVRGTLALMGAISWGNPVQWRTAANGFYALETATSAVQFGAAMFGIVNPIRQHYWDLVDALAAATTIEDLNAIDVTVGWP